MHEELLEFESELPEGTFYSTASSCIQAAEAANGTAALNALRETFVGHKLSACHGDLTELYMVFMNGYALRLSVDLNAHLCFEQKDAKSLITDAFLAVNDVSIRFYGQEGVVTDAQWNAKSMLQQKMEKTLKNIYYNGTDLYLYWDESDLCTDFSVVALRSTGDYCLYWFDDVD